MKRCFELKAWVVTLIVCAALSFLPPELTAKTPKRNAALPPPQQPPPEVKFASGSSALKIPLEIDNNIILMRVALMVRSR